MTHVIDVADLAHGETSYEFEGRHHGDAGVSFIVELTPPVMGAFIGPPHTCPTARYM